MSPSVDAAAVNELRGLAANWFGLRFGDDKQDFLEQTLRERLEATNAVSFSEYRRLHLPGPDELRALAMALTVPETYFFRGGDQLRAFQEAVLQDRIRVRGASRELRILSAGCSTGEEPYTLAMIILDAFPALQSWKVSVLGVDLNPPLLVHARRGRYSTWSLRETTPAARERCFHREAPDFVVKDIYRDRVTFRDVNLIQLPADLLQPGTFDVIFCRNVIMYLTPEAMAGVVERLARALVAGGYLFLGHAETLRGISSDFLLRHTHETFYYQTRAGQEALLPPDPAPVSEPPSRRLEDPGPDRAWSESIRESFDRVESLSRNPAGEPAASLSAPLAETPSGAELSMAVDLLRQERFQDALSIVVPLVAKVPRDLDTLLLQAVLLCHCGRPGEAETLCAEILRADDLNAEAHHLIALCREDAGAFPEAIEQDQIAQYLDPGFAMPPLHTGRLARRRGDLPLARRQLGHALSLLGREEASRILLFGGGFGREALIQLCRSELEACGGKE
jgi:chemotaxis protein methyltransferase CheR